MVIHTVQPDETIYSIADKYGISADKLIFYNQIEDPNRLVVGESLSVFFPRETYVVKEGDTLESIAASFDVSVLQLLRNNPPLSDRLNIYPGEEIIISFTDEKSMALSVNGYTFPFTNIDIIRKSLLYLTYLTIFYYRITEEGDIVNIDDQELIDIAKVYGVAPIMLISTLSDAGEADVEAAHSILTSEDKQEHLINNVLDNMRAKGYYGINIDMQNILPEDRLLFVDFIANISYRLRQEGYYSLITLTPHTFPSGFNILYQGPEYAALGQLTDSTMLLSYEWGHAHSPQPALPLADVRAFLDYTISQVPAERINIGIPTIGYIWQLPFTPGISIAYSITNNSAITLADETGVIIQRDAASEAPYFSYSDGISYIVWFRDGRSIAALIDIVEEYGLEGIGIWNVMQFPAELMLMINARFEIRKVE